jgi:hypothetical protein
MRRRLTKEMEDIQSGAWDEQIAAEFGDLPQQDNIHFPTPSEFPEPRSSPVPQDESVQMEVEPPQHTRSPEQWLGSTSPEPSADDKRGA